MSIRYGEKMDLIREELLKCARSQPMQLPSYREFGARVGVPTQGPWKSVLDAISHGETSRGRPDITFLLLNQRTRYPGQIGFVRSKKPTDQQKAHARSEVQKVINRYNPGTPNPF